MTTPRVRSKRVTIDEVAKKAGVSKTSISRYLNGRYEFLSEETRERIRKVIEELNYRPNRVAQRLKSKNSQMIGCLISDIANPFSSIIVKGINSVCVEAGYELLLVDSGDDPLRERMGIRDLLENQVDGLIVNTTGKNDEYLLSLHEQGVPLVLADRCLLATNMVDTVVTESYQITYECICYLHELGYQQVGFFTQGNENVTPRIFRFQGFRDAMRDKYNADGNDLLYQFKLDDAGDCTRALTEFHDRFQGQRIAAFAVNGVTMLRLLHAFQETGIAIGAEFGVCGFDNWGWADLIPPGITTISQDSWSVGRKSAEVLLMRIKGEGPETPVYVEFPNEFEIRGSTVKGD